MLQANNLAEVETLDKHNRLPDSARASNETSMRSDTFHGLIGQSPVMQALFKQIRQIARAQGPVLIQGESGTGKERVARALCAESQRAGKPFVAVNCAGIPAELLESEFFGHSSGAFTGAHKGRKGLLQVADGGTLLLDEIAELPGSLQAKLLRALQDGSLRPIGQNYEHQVDVRIIAATHQDLRQRVKEGTFREDLYYRLETFTIDVPPLRQRGTDIQRIAESLLAALSDSMKSSAVRLSPEAMALLLAYDFPGNVRELQNIIERGVAFCEGDVVHTQHLPRRLQTASASPSSAVFAWHAEVEQTELPSLQTIQLRYVRHVLHQVQGNKRQAAKILGVGRRTLYRWLDHSPGI